MTNKIIQSLVLLLILLLSASGIYAQDINSLGSPIIENYTDKDYLTDSPQNWDLIQDNRGIMYFGNTEGVLEFDGKVWRLIRIPNNSVISAIAKDKEGKIFVGADSEIGYLTSDKTGNLEYKSLNSKIKEEERNFGKVYDICMLKDEIFFICAQNIFILKNNEIISNPINHKPKRGFVVNNNLFVVQKDSGLFLWEREKFLHLPFSSQFKSPYEEYIVLPYSKNEILFGTKQKGFFIYNMETCLKVPIIQKDVISKFHTDIDDYISENFLMTGLYLGDDKYAIGTLNGGILIINKQGKLLQIINKNRGLASNGVYRMILDENNNLWAGLVNGISKIEIKSPLSKFDETNGIHGLLLSTYIYKNKLYVGTTNGIYYSPDYKMSLKDDIYKFEHLNNTESYCWDFIEINNELYAAGDIGLIKIEGDKSIQINEVGQILKFTISKRFPDYLFMGTREGIAICKITTKNGKTILSEHKKITDISYAVWTIFDDKNGDIHFSTKLHGVYQIKFKNDDIMNFELIHYDESDGLPSMIDNYISKVREDLLICTTEGIYKYKISKESKPYKIVPETTFGKITIDEKIDIRQIYGFANGNYLIQSEKRYMNLIEKSEDGTYTINNNPFKKIGYVFRFAVEEDKNVWLYSNHGLFKYDPTISKNYNPEFNSLIRNVVVGNNTVIFGGTFADPSSESEDNSFAKFSITQPINEIPILKYSNNEIYFEFSSPFFEDEKNNQYSYMLEGYDKSWSEWSKETKREYTNLKENDYIFKVKAKNIYNNESTISEYKFSITPPWYRTIYAFISYLIFFIIIIYIVVIINSKRLKEANIKLEKIVIERTAEVEQQKEELITQAESLEVTNIELEKLSIVARETDNAVIIMDAETNFIWINESLTRNYGYTFDEFIREKHANLITSSLNKEIKGIVEECRLTKESIKYESLIITKTGRKIWTQTTLTPILDENDNIVKFVAIDSDISKIKEAEEEIRQRNEEISTQQDLLSKTNVELTRNNKLITDSIKYSKNIQEAIFPEEKAIKKAFPKSFIFYKPKDIVSGDFYWFTEINNKSFFAVVDCTGHGVPGALMSMIGNTILNEIILEKQISTPSKILDYLNSRVIASLIKGDSNDEEMSTDGMDITICSYDKVKSEVQIASANQTAFIIKDNKVKTQITGDIYSIGDIFALKKESKYTNYKLSVEKGETLYMFSDGFQDQFGGDENKKFMAGKFRDFLAEIQHMDINEQLSICSSTFEKWKGVRKQTDDILVTGIEFI